MKKAYGDNFTEEDLQAMLAFYKSPVGQKVLIKMPEIMRSSMEIVQESMKDIMPRLQEVQKELEEELNKSEKRK
jgi:uncharacterized protein